MRPHLRSVPMETQHICGLVVAFFVAVVILIHNFEQESRVRRENIFKIHLLRRRAVRRHYTLKRRAVILNGDYVLLTHRRQRSIRTIWVFPRSCDWWKYINNTWTDHEWLQNLRMQRSSFILLCDTLRPWLTRQNTRYRKPVPVEIRVAICIWRLATNLEYRSISHLFGVGVSTCCIITQEVVTAINVIMKPQYIKKPSAAEFKMIVQGFRDRWGFPQVAGAIDGTHINIKAPSNTPADYYNRKGNYSIVLQAVVDNKMKFWDINVGQPGKIHDARVFCLSSLFDRGSSGTLLPTWTETFEAIDVPLFLLGDSAYPLSHWLMKPYPEGRGVTPEQIKFNHRLSQARMTVERAFGRLKGRWRCLLKQCEAHITLVSRIVSACCVLHNFCEVRNEEFYGRDDVREEEEQSQDARPQEQENVQGNNVRDALCRYFSRI